MKAEAVSQTFAIEVSETFGVGLTVVVMEFEVEEQPLTVLVTEKLPAVFTTIDEPVAPVDQTIPLLTLEVKVTLSPSQKEVEPFAVITGAVGMAFTVTLTGVEVALQPF